MASSHARLAVDIGGTFTDIVLERPDGSFVSGKYLTTHAAPEQAVLEGTNKLLESGGISAQQVGAVVHGTTLATNALIERKGARTALITTRGFRDSLEMGHEYRFAVYDLNMVRPTPLVPRQLRLEVDERLYSDGSVAIALDEDSARALIPILIEKRVESVAICLLHSYASAVHEIRLREIFIEALPDVAITLSHEVCPEIREYERASTSVANAYVMPLIADYLRRLENDFRQMGIAAPLMLMTSNGGLTTVDLACRHPVRLVESGPAGGAILAAKVARDSGIARAIALDMGGTTAKLVLIDDGRPSFSRHLEIARVHRFLKGSGLPLQMPVIDLVEIGAGGGSVCAVDSMRRIVAGPESLGSEPGPACYARGGDRPGITDADLILGKIDPDDFAAGTIALRTDLAERAVQTWVAGPLGVAMGEAAAGMAEVVDENMANAARVHASDNGQELSGRVLIATGGAAPLHAARIAQKLGIDRVLIPVGAGVGSAHGFLSAAVSYEAVRSRRIGLSAFDPDQLNQIFDDLRREAEAVVRLGIGQAEVDLVERRVGYFRYAGQGHELPVELPSARYDACSAEAFRAAFETVYAEHFTRPLSGVGVECITWTLALSAGGAAAEAPAITEMESRVAQALGERQLFDLASGIYRAARLYKRDNLGLGASLSGPAIIAEAATSTVVPDAFVANVTALGHILLSRAS